MIGLVVEFFFLYLIIGLVLLPFIAMRGLSRIDEVTRHSTLGFRVLVAPGLVMLWPMMLMKWIRA